MSDQGIKGQDGHNGFLDQAMLMRVRPINDTGEQTDQDLSHPQHGLAGQKAKQEFQHFGECHPNDNSPLVFLSQSAERNRRFVTFQSEPIHQVLEVERYDEEIGKEIWYSAEDLLGFRNVSVSLVSTPSEYENVLNEAYAGAQNPSHVGGSSPQKIAEQMRNTPDFFEHRGLERKCLPRFAQIRSLTKRRVREVLLREQAQQWFRGVYNPTELASACIEASKPSVHLATLLGLADEAEAVHYYGDSIEEASGPEKSASSEALLEVCAEADQNRAQNCTKRSWFDRLWHPVSAQRQPLPLPGNAPRSGLFIPLLTTRSNLNTSKDREATKWIDQASTEKTQPKIVSRSGASFASIEKGPSTDKTFYGDVEPLVSVGKQNRGTRGDSPLEAACGKLFTVEISSGEDSSLTTPTMLGLVDIEDKENSRLDKFVQEVASAEGNTEGALDTSFFVPSNSVSEKEMTGLTDFALDAWN